MLYVYVLSSIVMYLCVMFRENTVNSFSVFTDFMFVTLILDISVLIFMHLYMNYFFAYYSFKNYKVGLFYGLRSFNFENGLSSTFSVDFFFFFFREKYFKSSLSMVENFYTGFHVLQNYLKY